MATLESTLWTSAEEEQEDNSSDVSEIPDLTDLDSEEETDELSKRLEETIDALWQLSPCKCHSHPPRYITPNMDEQRYQQFVQLIDHGTTATTVSPEEEKKLQGQAQHFITHQQILYKKNRHDPTTPLRIVKTHEAPYIIRRLHEDPRSGHLGVANTFKRTSERYY